MRVETLNFQWHQLCNFEDVFVLPVSDGLNFLVLLALPNIYDSDIVPQCLIVNGNDKALVSCYRALPSVERTFEL